MSGDGDGFMWVRIGALASAAMIGASVGSAAASFVPWPVWAVLGVLAGSLAVRALVVGGPDGEHEDDDP